MTKGRSAPLVTSRATSSSTADVRARRTGEPPSRVRWVGGVGDGEFGAVGQHLKGLGSTLEARKSWFCTAGTVICLGAGITASDGVRVETVVDNRNLGEGGSSGFALDAAARPRWAHLDGHGGWVFPGGTTALHTLREARTGAWSDINTTSSAERRTRTYQTLWLDHGVDPVGASYSYQLMPGASRQTVAARAADTGWLKVAANTAACQAMAVPALDLVCANFWQAGSAGPLSVSAPASVLVRSEGVTGTLRVSEPPRTGQPFEVTWNRPVRRVTSADSTVEVLAAGKALRLRITPGTAGASHRCDVALI
ncbi:hypothetical protein A8W25_21835 [Streptomyces sp. ERV7]|nr:hypothetical protein A8W25_21835 [Streptomyces sp. ERV7]